MPSENLLEIIRSPVESWKGLVESPIPDRYIQSPKTYLSNELKAITLSNLPEVVAITMNSFCPGKCRHCIYPRDFYLYNKNLESEIWKEIITGLHSKLGFKKYVINGRGLNKDILDSVEFIKGLDGARVGFIVDGRSASEHIDDMLQSNADWIDVSLDGMKEHNDEQRDHSGSFEQNIELLKRLHKEGTIPKVSVLTTLTRINHTSIQAMIEYLNKEIGVRNFHITPVNYYKNIRPEPKLRPSKHDFNALIDGIRGIYRTLNDSFIMFHLYSPHEIKYLKNGNPDIYNNMTPKKDKLLWDETDGDNEFHISISPGSLTGSREFIINSDGRIIPGAVMALGDIPQKYVFGNIIDKLVLDILLYLDDPNSLSGKDKTDTIRKNREVFFYNLMQKQAFNHYLDELVKERRYLLPS